jgi:Xaa-Pro dipeptidase
MDKTTEITLKTDRLVRTLDSLGLGGVLINGQHNFSWLTAGGTNAVDISRESGAGALLVRNDGKRFVLASSIEMPRLLAEELSGMDFEAVEFAWEDEKASPEFLAERALALLPQGSQLGSDLSSGTRARVIEAMIARCRYSLSEAELERYRKLGREAGDAIEQLVRSLEPGQTEKEVARRAADALAAKGMQSVVVLVAADERLKRFRHPIPTEQRWQKVIMVVVCARRGGQVAALSRIVCVGTVPHEMRRRMVSTARVNATLLSATRPGAVGSELYKFAARTYANEGFEGEERLHHQGGACGYRTRDWVAHPTSSEVVQDCQAFAWNPSITGAKVEETSIAFTERTEVITSTQTWPQIPVLIEGLEYLSPDVLVL